MKKLYALALWFLMFAFALSNASYAQTTIANGLVKVSNETNDYWYYIENGHSSTSKITNADGRFCALITSHGGYQTGATNRASIDFMHPNVDRPAQRWKVVASAEEGYYYLINQKEEYLHLSGNVAYADIEANVPNLSADGAKFSIGVWPTSSYYTYIKAKGANYNMVGLNGGGTGYWGLETPTTAGSNNTIAGGIVANPRSWRFVAVEEMDDFYPTIKPVDTNSSDITEWYFIKSINPSQSAAPYLTVNGSTVALNASKSPDALFGFVGNGRAMTGNPTQGGSKSLIVPFADKTKYLAGTALSSAKSDWWLKHVIAPAYSSTPQATITDGRSGSSYKYLVSSTSNTVTMKQSSNTDTGDGATISTYDNEYAWTYEKAYVVGLEKGYGVSVSSPADASAFIVEEGQPFTLSFTLDSSVGLAENGVSINGVSTEPTLSSGVYTVSISSISASYTKIKIETVVSAFAMNTTADETIAWSSAPATSVSFSDPYQISFTVAEGFHYPYLIVNNEVKYPTLAGGVYTYSIASVTKPYTISVSSYPANILPVKADTWVDGRTVNGNNYNTLDLRVQASTSSYVRVSYLEFDASDIVENEYDNAHLVLKFKELQSEKTKNPKLEVRTVPETLGSLSTMTWSNNGEQNGVDTRFGESISDMVEVNRSSAPGTAVRFDVSGYVLDALTNNSLRLQVAGKEDNDAGFTIFYSSEGAIDLNDLSLMPVLEFTKSIKVSVDVAEGIYVLTPTGTSPYNANGSSFVMTFTVDETVVPGVRIDGENATAGQLTLGSGGIYTLTIEGLTADTEVEIFDSLQTGFKPAIVPAHILVKNQILTVSTESVQQVEIYNAMGVLVSKEQVVGSANYRLPNGLYVVKVDNHVRKIKI